MALNQVGTLPRNVHSPSGTIKLRLSEFSYLETQPGSSSTRPLSSVATFFLVAGDGRARIIPIVHTEKAK